MDSVEAGPEKPLWRKASYSVGNGACVEVSSVNGNMLVRDSQIPDSPMIGYPAETWRSFLAGIKANNAISLRERLRRRLPEPLASVGPFCCPGSVATRSQLGRN